MFHFPTDLSNITQQPIFLLSSSHRCGSTLLQRLLNSSREILIWGEHNGYLNEFAAGFQTLLNWEASHADERNTFFLEGFDNFVPNMMPERFELREAARLFLVSMFGVPAAKQGRPVWGFKEVRYGADIALFLQELFPESRFIHLTRNPVDALISMKVWEESPLQWKREWTERSITNWGKINASFLENRDRISHLLTVRFEDMIADPRSFQKSLANFLNLPYKAFDRRVFKQKIHGPGAEGRSIRPKKIKPSDLSEDARALLTRDRMVEVAQAYGYKIDFSR